MHERCTPDSLSELPACAKAVLTSFYLRHQDWLDWDDAKQEAMVACWLASDTDNERAIARKVRRALIDYARRMGPSRRSMSGVRVDFSDALPERSYISDHDLIIDVKEQLRSLPVSTRQIVFWRMMGWNTVEIANALGVHPHTLRMRLFSARASGTYWHTPLKVSLQPRRLALSESHTRLSRRIEGVLARR